MGRGCLRVPEMGPLTAQALAGPHLCQGQQPPIPSTVPTWTGAVKPLRLLLGFCLQVGQAQQVPTPRNLKQKREFGHLGSVNSWWGHPQAGSAL